MGSYSGCEWGDFALEPGQRLYRWRISQGLERSTIALRVADVGEDAGRLVAVSDDAREQLLDEPTRQQESGREPTVSVCERSLKADIHDH